MFYHIQDFRSLICSWRADVEDPVIAALQLTVSQMFLWPVIAAVSENQSDNLRELLFSPTPTKDYPSQVSCRALLQALGNESTLNM